MFPSLPFSISPQPRRPSSSTVEATNPLSHLHAPSATSPHPLSPILWNTAATATITGTLPPAERFSDLPGHQPHQLFFEPDLFGKHTLIIPILTFPRRIAHAPLR